MRIKGQGECLSSGTENNPRPPRRKNRLLRPLRQLGPGLITGASDDDPSGIATYSQVGASLGYAMLWTQLFSIPLMVAIQQISAQIGRVTGRGLAGNMHKYYPKWLLYGIVALVLVANTINLGADLIMMGDSVRLMVGGSTQLYVIGFALIIVVLEIFVSFKRYETWLKWLTLALFSYAATAFVVHVHWGEAFRSTLVPSFSFTNEWLMALTALLGTTISPYMFIWQAAQEVQDQETCPHEEPLLKAPSQAPKQLDRICVDTRLGMVFANLTSWFIILTAAATLHANGLTNIQTSAQAASALRPLAGPLAFYLFAAGVIGTGLLAVPVLAGSAAYAAGEAFRWRVGLQRKFWEAKGFYGVLLGATGVGLLMAFISLNPIKALYGSAVINGIVAGPIMVVMLLMGANPKVMGQFTLSPWLRITGWVATAVMLLCAVALLATIGR